MGKPWAFVFTIPYFLVFAFSACSVLWYPDADLITSSQIGSIQVRSDQIFTSWTEVKELRVDWASLGSTRQIGKMATRIVIVIFAGFTLLLNLMLLLLLRVLFATALIFAFHCVV